MKFSIGRAKNEAFELIFGDSLIAFAGVGVGLILTEPQAYALLVFCIAGFVFGFIFDVRALRKFRFDLQGMEKKLEDSRMALSNLITQSRLIQTELIQARQELHNTVQELQRTRQEVNIVQKQLEKTSKELHDAKEKVFGTSGGTFSRASWANPLDKMVEDLQKTVRRLEEEVKRMNRGW